MRIRRTADLEQAYAEAPLPIRKAFDKQLRFLALDFRHRSLRAKPWPPHGPDHFQAYVTMDWRFYYLRQGDEAIVYWLQKHPKKGG